MVGFGGGCSCSSPTMVLCVEECWLSRASKCSAHLSRILFLSFSSLRPFAAFRGVTEQLRYGPWVWAAASLSAALTEGHFWSMGFSELRLGSISISFLASFSLQRYCRSLGACRAWGDLQTLLLLSPHVRGVASSGRMQHALNYRQIPTEVVVVAAACETPPSCHPL